MSSHPLDNDFSVPPALGCILMVLAFAVISIGVAIMIVGLLTGPSVVWIIAGAVTGAVGIWMMLSITKRAFGNSI